MISTDRKIFEEGSNVRARQAEYAKDFEEVHIVVFAGEGAVGDKNTVGGKKVVGGGASEQVISSNCWAYSTRSFSKILYPFDAMKLGRFIIDKRGITDITCQDASLTAMAGLSLKKSAAKRGANISLEIQVHEDIGALHYAFNVTNKIRKYLALSYLPKADAIRVVSNKIKDYLVGTLGISGDKITVRPISVDTLSIKAAPVLSGADLRAKYPQFDKIVLIVSRFEREKNLELAIKAWPLVIGKLPNAGLVIVGIGSLEVGLKKAVKDLEIDGSVIFEPWAGRAVLYSYYKTTDLFLNTSFFEGYGMALVEASAAGRKIVSTDVGVAKEIGATIVDWDVGSVADGITRVLGL